MRWQMCIWPKGVRYERKRRSANGGLGTNNCADARNAGDPIPGGMNHKHTDKLYVHIAWMFVSTTPMDTQSNLGITSWESRDKLVISGHGEACGGYIRN